MKYTDVVSQVARLSIRNPFAILLISGATTVSMLPFFTGILMAGVPGGIVGLWTSSMMLGFVGVGGASISTVVLIREVSLGTSHFWEGMVDGMRMATVTGAATFAVTLVSLLVILNPFDDLLGMSIAVLGVYVMVSWFVLATFSLALWAEHETQRDVTESFTAGWLLIIEQPIAAVVLVVQTVGWTLLSLPLIIAPVLIVPGFIQLIGTAIARRAVSDTPE